MAAKKGTDIMKKQETDFRKNEKLQSLLLTLFKNSSDDRIWKQS